MGGNVADTMIVNSSSQGFAGGMKAFGEATQAAMSADAGGGLQLRFDAGSPLQPSTPAGSSGPSGASDPQGIANAGLSGGGGTMPHASTIQASFGSHDISGIKAHTGAKAQQANSEMGSKGYAKGGEVALGSTDLFTAAHEATHAVLQQGGVSLSQGVGASNDAYEKHADAVASLVVSGQSAEGLLSSPPSSAGGGGGEAVQHSIETVMSTQITVNLSIPLGNPAIRFNVGVQGGVEHITEGGQEKTKATLSIAAGISVDLFFLNFGVRVTGSFEATVNGNVDPLTAINRGLEDLGKWVMAGRMANLQAYKAELDAKHQSALTAGLGEFDNLAGKASDTSAFVTQAAVGTNWGFDTNAKDLQQDIEGFRDDIRSFFSDLGGDPSEALSGCSLNAMMAPMHGVAAGVTANGNAGQRRQLANSGKALFRTVFGGATANVQRGIAAIPGAVNSSDVHFEAGVKIEAFAGANLTSDVGGEVSIGGGYYISDGTGEAYDTENHDMLVGKVSVTFPGGSGSVEYENKNGRNKIKGTVSMRAPVFDTADSANQRSLSMVWNAMRGATGDGWRAVKDAFTGAVSHNMSNPPKPGNSGSAQINVQGEIEWGGQAATTGRIGFGFLSTVGGTDGRNGAEMQSGGMVYFRP